MKILISILDCCSVKFVCLSPCLCVCCLC